MVMLASTSPASHSSVPCVVSWFSLPDTSPLKYVSPSLSTIAGVSLCGFRLWNSHFSPSFSAVKSDTLPNTKISFGVFQWFTTPSIFSRRFLSGFDRSNSSHCAWLPSPCTFTCSNALSLKSDSAGTNIFRSDGVTFARRLAAYFRLLSAVAIHATLSKRAKSVSMLSLEFGRRISIFSPRTPRWLATNFIDSFSSTNPLFSVRLIRLTCMFMVSLFRAFSDRVADIFSTPICDALNTPSVSGAESKS